MSAGGPAEIQSLYLGLMPYREAWAVQEQAHGEVLAGGAERLLVVEHPPVITFGRRGPIPQHLVASEESLRQMGVEVVQTDRGGDVTFHGPGQLVVYPIIRLAHHRLSVGAYVHALEGAVIDCLAEWGVSAYTDPAAIGAWVGKREQSAKVCAFGVRVKRGVTLHGLALNITTDLRYFQLIVPCGLAGRPVTRLSDLLGERSPSLDDVARRLVDHLSRRITAG